MQRLTWDGIALHGGSLPGHPASHGCVRLPQAFAQKLFSETQRGDTVVVADAKSSPMTLAYPAVLAPVNAAGRPCRTQRAGRRRRRGGTTAPRRPVRSASWSACMTSACTCCAMA